MSPASEPDLKARSSSVGLVLQVSLLLFLVHLSELHRSLQSTGGSLLEGRKRDCFDVDSEGSRQERICVLKLAIFVDAYWSEFRDYELPADSDIVSRRPTIPRSPCLIVVPPCRTSGGILSAIVPLAFSRSGKKKRLTLLRPDLTNRDHGNGQPNLLSSIQIRNRYVAFHRRYEIGANPSKLVSSV